MNTKILTTTLAATALLSIAVSPGIAAKKSAGEKASQSITKNGKKLKSTGFIFRPDAAHDRKRRITDGKGPGFELGFDGHSGGL